MRPSIFLLPLLLLLPATLNAAYHDPPLANVTEHNLGLAPNLNSTYDSSIAANGTIAFDFNGTDIYWRPVSIHLVLPLMNASARLLCLDPSIDNATSAEPGPSLIFAWGYNATPLVARDWDGDDCAEIPVGMEVTRIARINFTFRNASAIADTQENVIRVPEPVLREMSDTTGRDVLRVRLNATFSFRYEVDDRRPSHDEGCSHHPMNFTSSISVVDGMNYSVEGNRTLFFLRSPVLGEQWYRNNHFDTIVLTNARLYKGSVSGPGNQTGRFRLSDFNITNGTYGIWRVVSVPPGEGGGNSAGYAAYNTPTPLDWANHTYGYAYEFNYTYSGLGENTLALEVESPLGGKSSFSRQIMSRMLTHSGNTTEAGGPASGAAARPSIGSASDSMSAVVLALGLVGLLLAALLMNRFYKK